MAEALISLFRLQWRTLPPKYCPLPAHVERCFVPTPGENLELLISRPQQHKKAPPVFFAHGGCSCARVWLDWIDHLHNIGYESTLYACSLRNHGASYSVPFYRMVWGTPLTSCLEDLLACFHFAQTDAGAEDFVFVGHSSGGGLLQYLLAKSLVRARALCLLDSIPHFGSYGVYWNWFKTDSWLPLRSMLHLQHPTSPSSSGRLVHQAFFGRRYPREKVQEFRCWMPAYESMGWPLGMFGEFWAWWQGKPRWLNTRDIARSTPSFINEGGQIRLCIIVGSEDMMIDVEMCSHQAAEYRQAVKSHQLATPQQRKSLASDYTEPEIVHGWPEGVQVEAAQGVELAVVEGAGHHSQNDVQRETGAQVLQRFLRQV